MAKCRWSGDSAFILKSDGLSPAAGALYDISLRSYTASSHSNLAIQHRTLIYIGGPETDNRELVLGMGSKQGLEEGNREPVLEMGA